MDLFFFPLILAILLVVWGVDMYYNHRYDIADESTLNKYRLPKEHFLIKLKLFKYNNDFNYFLLVPYLMGWNIFFIILTLYILYWCGVTSLVNFFTSKWVLAILFLLYILYLLYFGIFQHIILLSNRTRKTDFKWEENSKEADKDNSNK